MQAALERDMPVLAICRGSQLLNVARGGDLVQHLPEIVGDDKHKVTPGVFAAHDVAVEPESRLGSLIGPAAHVESHHHQGIGRVGDGLEVVAYADDGTAEAVEDRERRFTVGVLWHPEEGEDLRLFEALVEQAKGYREAPRLMGRLEGKVCVITGAGGGMGRVAAEVFTAEGARVVRRRRGSSRPPRRRSGSAPRGRRSPSRWTWPTRAQVAAMMRAAAERSAESTSSTTTPASRRARTPPWSTRRSRSGSASRT